MHYIWIISICNPSPLTPLRSTPTALLPKFSSLLLLFLFDNLLTLIWSIHNTSGCGAMICSMAKLPGVSLKLVPP